MGPLVKNFSEKMCQCSQSYCNRHGRCLPRLSKIVPKYCTAIYYPSNSVTLAVQTIMYHVLEDNITYQNKLS